MAVPFVLAEEDCVGAMMQDAVTKHIVKRRENDCQGEYRFLRTARHRSPSIQRAAEAGAVQQAIPVEALAITIMHDA
jgi:hypothetical protein